MTDGAATGGTGRLPLTGFRVLELSHIVAGPSGGLLLADLGADVIKVEEPRGGDQSRAMPNRGSTFYALNRNKRSLAVDFKISRQGSSIASASATSGAPASTRGSSTVRSRGSCRVPLVTAPSWTNWPR